MKRIIIIAALALLTAFQASAQRFSVGTNALEWATLGTMEADLSAALARRVTFHVGVQYNPWTFHKGDVDRQFESRQLSGWAGFRYWPWHVYSGWWVGADAKYTQYNIGGFRADRLTEEGDAIGGALWGGYDIMLSDRWNIDLGVGVWAGNKRYRDYSCPICGRIVEQGNKFFIIPDLRVAIQYIF